MIDNTGIRVGKGRRTLYWNDDWLGHGSVKELFPGFYSIATLPEANLETVKGVQRWNITFKRLLHDLPGKEGVFTVKSSYTLLSRSNHQIDHWPCLRWSMPATICELLMCWNYDGGAVRQKRWWKLVPACMDNLEGKEL
ncbi:hypothetical protein MTR67_047457 [Solanum verrucosum]|uniref:Uncharacterized protein n=1 Tax=Solanum verrucosum TaxID=315347 RepID=A0AAF0UX48_SOLVR|nr:hypothetical protein MTR67_047457 [Solanum verrucosum]